MFRLQIDRQSRRVAQFTALVLVATCATLGALLPTTHAQQRPRRAGNNTQQQTRPTTTTTQTAPQPTPTPNTNQPGPVMQVKPSSQTPTPTPTPEGQE